MRKKKAKNDNVIFNDRIVNYVDSFFEGIHYSKETQIIKNNIISKISNDYDDFCRNDKRNAFKKIVKKYDSLEKMLESVSVDKKKIDTWYDKEVTISYSEFKKLFKKERRHIYLTTILGIISFAYLLQSILFFHKSFLFFFALSLLFLCIEIFAIRKYRKNNNNKEVLSVDFYEELEKTFDKYSKRSINWMMIAYLEFFIMLLNFIVLSVNSKTYEIIESFNNNLFTIEITIFFFIKNYLIIRWLMKKMDFENEKKYNKLIKNTVLFSTIYWIVGILVFYVFEKVFVLNITSFIGALFVLYIIINNFTKIKEITYHRRKTSKIVVASILLIALLFGGYTYLSRDIWLTQPYINSIPYIYDDDDTITYNEENGVYTITSNEDDFKILQLTDIHLGGSVLSYDKDKKALKAVYELIDYTKPDLVVVTGDLTFPMGIFSFSFNNTAPVQQFAAFMRNTGVPWAFTYGNHDTESMAIGSKEDLDELYKSLSWKTSKNLLYPYIQPKVNGKQIWGRNNQYSFHM